MELTWELLAQYPFRSSEPLKAVSYIIEKKLFPNDLIFCKTSDWHMPSNGVEITPPQNKGDRDMPLWMHKILVGAFQKMGFKANRNNSIYVFPNAFDVVYGTEYGIWIPYPPIVFTVGIWCRDLYTEPREYQEWQEIFPDLEILMEKTKYLDDDPWASHNIETYTKVYDLPEHQQYFKNINAKAFIDEFKYRNEGNVTIAELKEAQYNRSEFFFNCKGYLLPLEALEEHFRFPTFTNLKVVNSDKELRYGEDWEEMEAEDEEWSDE